MANALKELVDAPKDEKEKRGTLYTPQEIFQQPEMWRETLKIIQARKDEILAFLGGGKDRQFVLSGAGTSEFIGLSLQNLFNKVSGYDTKGLGTTGIVTDPDAAFQEGRKYFLVHFARSGNSPESVGTFTLGEESKADVKHIVITCNKDGKLAKMGEKVGALTILLPEKTNDESLAMTSSFSSMVVAGQCLATMGNLDRTAAIIEKLAAAGEHVMATHADDVKALCDQKFTRAVFLGSNTLAGCAQECHLKLQEMTGGKVIAKHDSFLGLRHGPEAVVDSATLVVYLLSENPYTRRYELDLMGEVAEKKIGLKKVALCKQADDDVRAAADLVLEYGTDGIPDDYLTPVSVILGQLTGLFKSLACGLKPDAPSEAGIISRVVQGVKIYDRPLFQKNGEFKVIAG